MLKRKRCGSMLQGQQPEALEEGSRGSGPETRRPVAAAQQNRGQAPVHAPLGPTASAPKGGYLPSPLSTSHRAQAIPRTASTQASLANSQDD